MIVSVDGQHGEAEAPSPSGSLHSSHSPAIAIRPLSDRSMRVGTALPLRQSGSYIAAAGMMQRWALFQAGRKEVFAAAVSDRQLYVLRPSFLSFAQPGSKPNRPIEYLDIVLWYAIFLRLGWVQADEGSHVQGPELALILLVDGRAESAFHWNSHKAVVMFREPVKWQHFKQNKNLYLAFAVIAIGLVILLPLIIPKDFKYDMGLNDLIQAMGQFATAGAFIFAVFQFRYAKERDRQATLCAEAKSMHERIRSEASSIVTIEGPWVYKFSNVFGRMSNVASFLRRVFDAIDEGVEKDILRMYWQETTYAGFIRPFQLIHIEEFIDWDRTPTSVFDIAREHANSVIEAETTPSQHYLFYRALHIIMHEGIYLEDEDSPMFLAVRDEIMRFKILFHDHIDTLRYKSSNERPADMRVFAPAMAAIFVGRHGYIGPWENSFSNQGE